MHLAPARLHRERVSELVAELQHREDEPHHQQVFGEEHPVEHVLAELAPMRDRGDDAEPDDNAPQHEAPEPEERPRERHQPAEQPLGVEQRDLPGEDAEDLLHQQPLLLFLAAPEELGGVGRDVALEDVGRVQLAEELDHLVLGHGVVAELRERSVPDRLDGVLAVHQPDHEVGRRREAVEALRGEILQHVPGLAAVLVAVDLGMRPQQRRELRDPVPGRAEELLRHPLRGARTRGSAAGS